MINKTIVVEDLTKSYKDLKVLKEISFFAERGTVFSLLGPNGAGKTTTIKILSTLLYPDKGRAFVGGIDVVKNPNKVKSLIGLTGQYAAVDEYLTGRENLIMMGRLYRLSRSNANKKTDELLKKFDLWDARTRAVKTYSGGMRRRLDLAASLIASPPILFLDEPTTGLDPRSRLTMWEIIEELAESGTTILLTTQHMEEADRLADKITVIDEGRVIAEGTSEELKKQVGAERIEFEVIKQSDFTKALNLVKGDQLRSDAKKRTISITTKKGAHDLKSVLETLEKEKIEVDNVSLHRPTLDDVFLSLTGKRANKTENKEVKNGKNKNK
jgi:ABC-2 type transport system ATP-binding protein